MSTKVQSPKSKVRSLKPQRRRGAEAGKKLAVVHIPQEEPAIWQRELSAELEIGGEIHLIVRRDSIAECLSGIRNAAPAYDLDDECSISVSLRYWELDDDCNDLTIKVGATDTNVVDRPVSVSYAVRLLCASAKVRFAKALAKQQIVLIGEEGSLR